jgi:hypothetical protein
MYHPLQFSKCFSTKHSRGEAKFIQRVKSLVLYSALQRQKLSEPQKVQRSVNKGFKVESFPGVKLRQTTRFLQTPELELFAVSVFFL